MIEVTKFKYNPDEHENERASNAYLMSVIALMVGLPLPIVNLIATFIFYLGNRKSTLFVKWHSTQALISQLSMFIINTCGFWWTISIVFKDGEISNLYFSYVFSLIIFNLTEFIMTIYNAIQVRKGIHPVWWFYGDITNLIVKTND